MNEITVGEKIVFARKKRGFSQPQLAEVLNVSKAQLYHWEKGIRNPKIKTLNAISRVLVISDGYFDSSVGADQLDDFFPELNLKSTDELTYLYPVNEDCDENVNEKYRKTINEYIDYMTTEELRFIAADCANVFFRRIIKNKPVKDKTK